MVLKSAVHSRCLNLVAGDEVAEESLVGAVSKHELTHLGYRLLVKGLAHLKLDADVVEKLVNITTPVDISSKACEKSEVTVIKVLALDEQEGLLEHLSQSLNW